MSLLTLVETPEFIRRARSAGMSDDEKEELISFLAADPEVGISLGGGLRKVRFARAGGGKSGGYRVIHFYRSLDMPLFLLTVFTKMKKPISPALSGRN
jgi:hypothetical protein